MRKGERVLYGGLEEKGMDSHWSGDIYEGSTFELRLDMHGL